MSSTWQRIVQKYNDPAAWLTDEGRVFYFSDADQNDLVTGQTSFADTTPTFLLSPATGYVLIPLMVELNQTGTVAGGAVDVIIEFDDADRYSTGGTSETAINARPKHARTINSKCYTGATASAGTGKRIFGVTVGQDVSTAEGAVNPVRWRPEAGLDLLEAGSCMAIYTYASTTGPTWFWTIKVAEIPAGWLS